MKTTLAAAVATSFAKATVILGVALAAAGDAAAQQPQAASSTPDLSGIWNRLDTGGGGTYHGIDLMFPKAQLLPEAEAKLPPDLDQGLGPATVAAPPVRLANGAYLTPQAAAAGGPSPTAGRCNIRGFGDGIDINSAGVSIVQSKDEVVLLRDGSAGGRRIYLDRSMPDLSRITPSPGGYSVGRWENGALVVTTTGFAPGLVSFGRGWKDRETVLTEMFRADPDGQHVTITYTWNDPKIYMKPHTYNIVFERWDAGHVFENWCDASIDHPENYTSIVLPPAVTDGASKSDANKK
jgi:hypothetical protein